MIPLYCEGETEEKVVRPFVQEIHDRLRDVGSGLKVFNLRGSGNFKRDLSRVVKVHRQKEEVPVFALMDLYGAPVQWPRQMMDTAGRIEHLRSEMRRWAECDENQGFHPHVAVHELEAWILADPDAISKRLGGKHGPWHHPEGVDFDSPPSARLDDIYRKHHPLKKRYSKSKVQEGQLLFRNVRLERVRELCPNFRRFVEELEEAAGAET